MGRIIEVSECPCVQLIWLSVHACCMHAHAWMDVHVLVEEHKPNVANVTTKRR